MSIVPDVKSISAALRYHSEKTPDKVYLICKGKSLTYSEVDKMVDQGCLFLENSGLVRGDIFSMIIRNSIEYIVIYVAGLRLGCPINPYPFNLEPKDISRYLGTINPKVMFCQSNHYDGISQQKDLKVVLIKDDFLKNLKSPEKKYKDFISDPDSAACIYYSSGTTGNPKSIVVSHKNMTSNISSIVRGFKHSKEGVHLVILPLGHTASINYSFLPCTLVGSSIVIEDSFWKIRADFWKIVNKYKINYVQVVSSIIVAMVNTPYQEDTVRENKSLSYVGCGSAPLPVELQSNFKDKFGLKVSNLYGLSETGPTHVDYPLEESWIPGSIGTPLDVNQVMIVDDDGNFLGPNNTGEIVIKGDNVFIGYYNNQSLYDSVVIDGIFHTGDLGYYDESGFFYFVGREKDLIIKGGINIIPDEIDEVIFKLDEVKEAATVGISDRYLGEKICTYIVLKEDQHLDSQKIKDFCGNFLSRDKIPDIIKFVESIPKGPSGKILRKDLRA